MLMYDETYPFFFCVCACLLQNLQFDKMRENQLFEATDNTNSTAVTKSKCLGHHLNSRF